MIIIRKCKTGFRAFYDRNHFRYGCCTNGIIQYRVEVVIKKDGKFHQRKIVGEGISSKATKGDVYVDLGPYSKTLIMGASND